MPSILTSLMRAFQGKPPFDEASPPSPPANSSLLGMPPAIGAPSDVPPVATPPAAGHEPNAIQKDNSSTFPVIQVRRTQTRHNGSTMQIYCSIKNTWSSGVEVEKIRLLGKTHELRMSLRAGEEREVIVYSGSNLDRQQGAEALIDYKTETGDYFEAVHEVRYTFTSEKTYEVTELCLRQPIRDIYG